VGALAWGYVGRRRSSEPYGKTTAFTYDAAGNLTEVKTPGGSRVTMAYDAGGRMTSRVDPRGIVAGADAGKYRRRRRGVRKLEAAGRRYDRVSAGFANASFLRGLGK
jgi:YD repeat-containing protein